MKRPGPRKKSEDEMTIQELERENELVKRQNRDLIRKVEFLVEELRVARHTQHMIARRASYGTGYQQ